MTYYTSPITIEKEDGQYYAYSEDLPGVSGLGDSGLGVSGLGVSGLGVSIDAAKSSTREGIRLYIKELHQD